MADLTATCAWVMTPELLCAVQDRLGAPVDAYDNGGQTWLRNDGPGGEPIEWRLHPRPEFAWPGRTSQDLLPALAGAVARGEQPEIDPIDVWSGLEAIPAFDDPIEAEALGRALAEVLGRPPGACGGLDRDALGREWEKAAGHLDVVAWITAQLSPPG